MSNLRKNIRLRHSNKKHTFNYTFFILICLIILLITILAIKNLKRKKVIKSSCINEETFLLFKEIDEASKGLSQEIKADTVINVVSVGDILCEQAIYQNAYDSSTGNYDFSNIFSDIKQYTSTADITLGLLETNFVNDNAYSGTGKYNAPIQLANCLSDIGIDILHTSNNHTFDYGLIGIENTITNLNNIGISTVGSYKSEEDSKQILVKDVNGIKLAFLSYTESSNIKIPEEYAFSVNTIDKEKIKNDIITAKEQNVDFIFVHMHWGQVSETEENSYQKELADFLFENGADFIIGSHPANLQSMEVIENSNGENVFIAYSTGNFISASSYKYSNIEMILDIEITRSAETNKVRLTKVTYTPIYLLDNGKSSKNRYKLINIANAINNYENGNSNGLSESTYKKLKQAMNDIQDLTK